SGSRTPRTSMASRVLACTMALPPGGASSAWADKGNERAARTATDRHDERIVARDEIDMETPMHKRRRGGRREKVGLVDQSGIGGAREPSPRRLRGDCGNRHRNRTAGAGGRHSSSASSSASTSGRGGASTQ